MNSGRQKRRTIRHQAQAGQAMVEFMLVVVVLVILFASFLQMIMLMYAYTTIADAAKEGMRYAVVHGTGNTNCSGPGTTGPPPVTCSDTTGNNVVHAVIGDNAGTIPCTPTCGAAALSFQPITTAEVTVDYNPNGANGASACNVAGCMVRVTVNHTYKPLFGFGWPKFNLRAAADGRIIN
jgi:TadE-like protein